MKVLSIILVSFLLFSGQYAFAQETEVQQDSLRLQEALEILKEYSTNDSLRQALMILKENIAQDRTAKAIEILEEATDKSLEYVGGKTYIDSTLYNVKSDQLFQWFQEMARDSIQFSIYDVEGNKAEIWTNTPEMQSMRYWLHKSSVDSLGFWLYSLPTKGIMLVPDFDVYQESHFTEFKSSLMIPIPVNENPEEYKLIPFRKYPRIIRAWKAGVVTNIGFSQSYFEYWIKGGENNIAANIDILAFANYKKGKTEWENYLRWKYGLIQSDKIDEIIRNEDLLELNSKFGLKASKSWYYSTQLNIKTQLFDGYSYKNEKKERLSDFFSPGYLSLALGMDYKPDKHFSLLLSPITGRLIYMDDIKTLDETVYGIEKGKHVWQQLGPYVRMKWNNQLFKSVNVDTSLELFSNYANKFGNIDVDWSTSIDMKINYFMSTRLSFQMIYDDDVAIPLYEKVNNKKVVVGSGQRLQINQNLSLGLVFRL